MQYCYCTNRSHSINEEKLRTRAYRKASKGLRTERRISGLRDVDRKVRQTGIEKLDGKNHVKAKEYKRLNVLKGDLKLADKDSADREHEHNDSQRLGTKSIFFDSDWNPDGEAPQGHKNIPYNQNTFKRKEGTFHPKLAGLDDIPLPSDAK